MFTSTPEAHKQADGYVGRVLNPPTMHGRLNLRIWGAVNVYKLFA